MEYANLPVSKQPRTRPDEEPVLLLWWTSFWKIHCFSPSFVPIYCPQSHPSTSLIPDVIKTFPPICLESPLLCGFSKPLLRNLFSIRKQEPLAIPRLDYVKIGQIIFRNSRLEGSCQHQFSKSNPNQLVMIQVLCLSN